MLQQVKFSWYFHFVISDKRNKFDNAIEFVKSFFRILNEWVIS